MMKTINKIREITGQVSQKHVGAYAAQSAYFFVLSMILSVVSARNGIL